MRPRRWRPGRPLSRDHRGRSGQAGADAEDVVRTRSYLVDRADEAAVSSAHGRVFGEIRPASTMIVVAGLLDPRWKVEMEAEAILEPAD